MKRFKKISLAVLLITLFFLLIIYNCFIHNFSSVIPHQIYRSGELSQKQLEHIIKTYQIRSIINLRGAHPQLPWYQNELTVTHAAKIAHYDISLSSYKLPTPETLTQLIDVLMHAAQPILVHCNSGVDRTSFASMIGLILYQKSKPTLLEKQISWRYFVFRTDSVGKQVLSIYKDWLTKNHLKSCKKHFLQWVEQYDPQASFRPKQ